MRDIDNYENIAEKTESTNSINKQSKFNNIKSEEKGVNNEDRKIRLAGNLW